MLLELVEEQGKVKVSKELVMSFVVMLLEVVCLPELVKDGEPSWSKLLHSTFQSQKRRTSHSFYE